MKQTLRAHGFRVVLLFSVLALLPALALAHAHLKSSDPEKNQVVEKTLETLTLTFSEDVEAKFSKVVVTDTATKKRVDTGEVTPGNHGKDALVVILKTPLAAGHYHVHWKATSVDTHKSHGEYDFTYSPKK